MRINKVIVWISKQTGNSKNYACVHVSYATLTMYPLVCLQSHCTCYSSKQTQCNKHAIVSIHINVVIGVGHLQRTHSVNNSKNSVIMWLHTIPTSWFAYMATQTKLHFKDFKMAKCIICSNYKRLFVSHRTVSCNCANKEGSLVQCLHDPESIIGNPSICILGNSKNNSKTD